MQVFCRSSFIVAVLWVLMSFMPMLGMVFPDINVNRGVVENRQLATLPSFHWNAIATFPEQFENYFNDNFGYRKLFIRLNGVFQHEVFHVSDRKGNVLTGTSGWLYYTANDAVDDYRGLNPFSADELETWQRVLEKKRDWLNSQGIKYLFVVAPNKSSIYPEHFPAWITRVSDKTPLDQLIEHLSAHSDIEILDLRPTLLAESRKGPLLYSLTDSHWNDLGAFTGYRKIASRVKELLPQISPLTFNDVTFETKTEQGGDLAKYIGIQEGVTETLPSIVPLNPQAKLTYSVAGREEERIMETDNSNLPRAVIFRDSFAIALFPYLSEDFNYARYLLTKWQEDTPIEQIISESKPDIIIEEWVERHVNSMKRVSFAPQGSSF